MNRLHVQLPVVVFCFFNKNIKCVEEETFTVLREPCVVTESRNQIKPFKTQSVSAFISRSPALADSMLLPRLGVRVSGRGRARAGRPSNSSLYHFRKGSCKPLVPRKPILSTISFHPKERWETSYLDIYW